MPRQAVFFLTDTQGAQVIGCYGRPELRTPNLDKLAASGIRFDQARTTQPVSGPARSALFTGLYPHSTGVLGNDMAPASDILSIGQRLTRAGVKTGYIGKWHLDGSDYFGDGQCPDGWDPDCWFDGRCYLESLENGAQRDLSRKVLGPREVAEHGISEDFTMAHRITERAIRFIEAHKDEDFFLVVSIDEPHHPAICPEPFVSMFEGFRYYLPDNVADTLEGKPTGQRDWASHVRRYGGIERDEAGKPYFCADSFFACNSYCDYEIGRVMDAIDARVPDALVVYTSDHGDMMWSHQLTGKGPAMYEENTRIPFIVRWPDGGAKGECSSALVSHIDLVPTFLEYFDAPVPPVLQGESLLDAFKNPEQLHRDIQFMEFNRFEVDHDGFGAFAPIRCAFDGRYKLSLNLLDMDELYDLKEDPGEMVNLIHHLNDPKCDDLRHKAESLRDAIVEWMGETRDPLRGPHWHDRPWASSASGQRRSTWGGPTRPKPHDGFAPQVLLYDTGKPVDRRLYDKG